MFDTFLERKCGESPPTKRIEHSVILEFAVPTEGQYQSNSRQFVPLPIVCCVCYMIILFSKKKQLQSLNRHNFSDISTDISLKFSKAFWRYLFLEKGNK